MSGSIYEEQPGLSDAKFGWTSDYLYVYRHHTKPIEGFVRMYSPTEKLIRYERKRELEVACLARRKEHFLREYFKGNPLAGLDEGNRAWASECLLLEAGGFVWSESSVKRFKRRADHFSASAKARWLKHPSKDRYMSFYLAFITLTITSRAGIVNSRDGYDKLLSPYLDWLTRTHRVGVYLWCREKQKNGQLHYHLVVDQFIHKQALKDKWNNLLRGNGYLKAYKEHYGNDNPNSTNVRSAYKTSQVGHYMAKYMTKQRRVNEDGGARLWGCSENLSSLSNFTHWWQPDIQGHMEGLAKVGLVRKVLGEHMVLYLPIRCDMYTLLPNYLIELKRLHCRHIMYSPWRFRTYEERCNST
jgi:hypothetical protein